MSWRGPTLMLLLVAALYVTVRPWVLQSLGPRMLALVLVGAALLVGLSIAAWQSRTRRLACPSCGHLFAVSLWGHLVGQNWFGRLRARCPSCGRTDWCDPVPTPQE